MVSILKLFKSKEPTKPLVKKKYYSVILKVTNALITVDCPVVSLFAYFISFDLTSYED